jgi:HAD superfamily hydrolase (TIGR01450 family)
MTATRARGRTDDAFDLRTALAGVRALVLDADGVLLFVQKPLPGAVEALDALEAHGIPYRVVTNFSLAHRESLAAMVSKQFGRPVDPARLITAASAAAAHTALHHAGEPLFVLASGDAGREWDGQNVVSPEEADDPTTHLGAVVIGDAGDALSFRNLDIAFRAIRNGAAFVAMHRNPWWLTPRGVTLDSGALVIGLEHALRRKATVTGKPSKVVFGEAVRELAAEAGAPRLRRHDVAMVGDDLDTDVGGAHRAGLRGILVLSGKTDAATFDDVVADGRLRGPSRPDGVAPGVKAVVEALIAAR